MLVQLDYAGAAHVHKAVKFHSRKEQLAWSPIRLADDARELNKLRDGLYLAIVTSPITWSK